MLELLARGGAGKAKAQILALFAVIVLALASLTLGAERASALGGGICAEHPELCTEWVGTGCDGDCDPGEVCCQPDPPE